MSSPTQGPLSRRRSAAALSEYVNRALDPLVARQGFGEATLLTQWEAIVGARIGAICAPERLIWPPRAKKRPAEAEAQPATLALRVEPGFGLDIQHMSGAIIDRVNAHLGWRCVAKLSLRQAESTRPTTKRAKPQPPNPAAQARAAAAAEGVEDEALRAALVALGERVLSRPRR
ncbi:MAG TPA: DciA family protein [Methylocystis sp.]|nr:DciA family protein [Methylocystis sp.]